jgi:hypothetical protein
VRVLIYVRGRSTMRRQWPHALQVSAVLAILGLAILVGLALWELSHYPEKVRAVLASLALTLVVGGIGGLVAWRVQRCATEAGLPGYDAHARRFGFISAFCRGWPDAPGISRALDDASTHILITGLSLRDTLTFRMDELKRALARGVSLKLLLLSRDGYERATERHPRAERARVGEVEESLELIDVLVGFAETPECRGDIQVRISQDVPYFTAILTDIPVDSLGDQSAPAPITAVLRVQPRIDDIEATRGPVIAVDPRREGAQLYLRGIRSMWCRADRYARPCG